MERDDELCASFFYRGRNMKISQRGRDGGGEGGVSDQFRKVNIVYFLSRNGTVEHHHLLRVHHHRSNGVHLRGQISFLLLFSLFYNFLRFLVLFLLFLGVFINVLDVKRWLGELRGKDMPDSFAWSYKRSQLFSPFLCK